MTRLRDDKQHFFREQYEWDSAVGRTVSLLVAFFMLLARLIGVNFVQAFQIILSICCAFSKPDTVVRALCVIFYL